ncbi:MAG: VOC family protein [Candidatus Brocadiia bacterium]
MKLEHVALNVDDPVAMAEWYERHLGMTVAMGMDEEPFTHFLRDSNGTMMLEVYKNPPDEVPNYRDMDPLLLHVAFVSDDPETDKNRLVEAGACLVKDQHLDDGSHIVLLRDPWGLCIQFCKRDTPLLSDSE